MLQNTKIKAGSIVLKSVIFFCDILGLRWFGGERRERKRDVVRLYEL